jgi:hypothetical protein
MILVDLNQVMISNLMQQFGIGEINKLEPDLLRHMVLNSLRSYRRKFHKTYGELVICCDGRDYWRKKEFPYYKASRKKDRAASSIDWHEVFSVLNTVRDEIKENMPYRVLLIPHAEADDIIATLCHEFSGKMQGVADVGVPIMIISGDKDFIQLRKYWNVNIYSPVQKKEITTDNPERFKREHIMRGDNGDGVPNFLSDDDTFVTEGKRQKPISRKKLNEWVLMEPEDFCDEEMLKRYKRNQKLVDLDMIPDDIRELILNKFDEYEVNDRSKILTYFIKYRLKNLMNVINEF